MSVRSDRRRERVRDLVPQIVVMLARGLGHQAGRPAALPLTAHRSMTASITNPSVLAASG
jgi:hypothetical protein